MNENILDNISVTKYCEIIEDRKKYIKHEIARLDKLSYSIDKDDVNEKINKMLNTVAFYLLEDRNLKKDRTSSKKRICLKENKYTGKHIVTVDFGCRTQSNVFFDVYEYQSDRCDEVSEFISKSFYLMIQEMRALTKEHNEEIVSREFNEIFNILISRYDDHHFKKIKLLRLKMSFKQEKYSDLYIRSDFEAADSREVESDIDTIYNLIIYDSIFNETKLILEKAKTKLEALKKTYETLIEQYIEILKKYDFHKYLVIDALCVEHKEDN